MTVHPILEEARRIADEVLFPRALETDAAGTVPVDMLDVLKDAGLYGIFSPEELGGSALEMPIRYLVQETLAGGCLTTAFVWQQHAGASAAAAATDGPAHHWARPMAAGDARGGVAFAHLVRPGEPILTAEPDGDGWRFSGVAPFVTGWGHIDVVLTAARFEDQIVWALLDGVTSATCTADRLNLAAIDSTDTFAIHYDGHPVSAAEVTSVVPFDGWFRVYQTGLRSNGSLALGITSRCLRLLGPSPLDAELLVARRRLDTSSAESMPAARGEMGALCLRAAGALVAATRGAAIFTSHQAQRLLREAMFLLVQGQTPEIKAVHVAKLASG